MMCLNVNGSLVNKLEYPEFTECMGENDIVLLSETWTNEKHDLGVNEFAEPLCKHRIRKKNAKRDSGGLVCYFKKYLFDGVSEIKWEFEDGVCIRLDRYFFWLGKGYVYYFHLHEGKFFSKR